jgi:hypothetical protein
VAKYEFKVEISTPDGITVEPPPDEPSLDKVMEAAYAGVAAAYPDQQVRVYDGNRPDRD